MLNQIKLAYHHSKLFKIRDALGNWVKESQIAARIALPPGRVDPFAGSFIIKRLSRFRDKMKPPRKVDQKNRPWRRHIAAVKSDFINAQGRLFCLFVFIAAGTDLEVSLFNEISPAAFLFRIFTMTAAAFGFFLTELNTYIPGSRLLEAFGQLIDTFKSDDAQRGRIEADVQ